MEKVVTDKDGASLALAPGVRQETLLAPQLRASLRVLQMDRQALMDEVRHEAEINPVVEIDDVEDTPVVSEEMAAEVRREDPPDDLSVDDDSNPSVNVDEDAAERRQRFFDRQVAVESLQEHLMAQVPQAGFTEDEAQLAEYLIGDIDDDGRYVGSLDELVQVLGVTQENLERVLAGIQCFDPPGVGARSLRECLRIQALELEVAEEVRVRLLQLIDRHLEDVASGNTVGLAESLGIAEAECTEVLKALRSLEPKPGRPYQAHGRHTQFIRPELSVTPSADGFVLKTCESDMPNLSISSFYRAMLEDEKTPAETQTYLRERIGSAQMLQEAISRRGETMMRIAEAIFSVQRDFFDGGFDTLKPLTIEQVAKRTGYHGTTVGRAVRGKYVRTPRGIFELKRFFCVGKLASDSAAGNVSAVVVKRKLASLVGADGQRRMTDEDLAAALGREGVHISRRTVAKYRAALNMPSTSARGRKGGVR